MTKAEIEAADEHILLTMFIDIVRDKAIDKINGRFDPSIETSELENILDTGHHIMSICLPLQGYIHECLRVISKDYWKQVCKELYT